MIEALNSRDTYYAAEYHPLYAAEYQTDEIYCPHRQLQRDFRLFYAAGWCGWFHQDAGMYETT